MRHRKTAVITGDGFRGSLNPGDEVSLRNVELAVVDGDVDVRITDDKCRSHLRHACTERTRCREQSQEYNEDLETREHSSVHADPKELFRGRFGHQARGGFFSPGKVGNQRFSKVSTANFPGPNNNTMTDATRKVYGAAA